MTARIYGASVLISILVGFLLAVSVILVSEPRDEIAQTVASSRGVRDLLLVCLLVSLPLSLPIGLVGGGVAVAVLKRSQRGGTPAKWMSHGAVWGGLLGLSGTALSYGLRSLMLGTGLFPPYLLPMSLCGGFAGVIAGCLVAIYSRRISFKSLKSIAPDEVVHRN